MRVPKRLTQPPCSQLDPSTALSNIVKRSSRQRSRDRTIATFSTPPARGVYNAGYYIWMVTLHLAVLNQNKFRTTPPPRIPRPASGGGTSGALLGAFQAPTHACRAAHTSKKRAKSVASKVRVSSFTGEINSSVGNVPKPRGHRRGAR